MITVPIPKCSTAFLSAVPRQPPTIQHSANIVFPLWAGSDNDKTKFRFETRQLALFGAAAIVLLVFVWTHVH
jgi:hypothetical protein